MITKWASRHSRNRSAMRSRQQDGAQDAGWTAVATSEFNVTVTFDRACIFLTEGAVPPRFNLSTLIVPEFPASWGVFNEYAIQLTFTSPVDGESINRERYIEDIRTRLGGYILPESHDLAWEEPENGA